MVLNSKTAIYWMSRATHHEDKQYAWATEIFNSNVKAVILYSSKYWTER